MKLVKAGIFFVVMALGCISAWAEPIMLLANPCSKWLEYSPAAKQNHYSGERELAIQFRGKVVGFLNGFAIGSGANIWAARGRVDEEAVYLWLDNYCRENPFDSFEQGLIKLARELEAKL